MSGRADDVIITGGVKVSASRIQQVIESLPGVESVMVLPVAHEQWGQQVGAAFSGTADPESVREAVRATLGAAAVPRRILQLPALPLLPNGKFDRMALGALLAAATE